MKRILASCLSILILSGCASTMYASNGEVCHPYGFENQDGQCKETTYRLKPGNALVAAVALPVFPMGTLLSTYILGWDLWGPVKNKNIAAGPKVLADQDEKGQIK